MAATAIVAAIGWSALYSGCMAATSDRRQRRRMRRFRLEGWPPDLGDPARGGPAGQRGRSAVVQANGKTVKVTVRGRPSRVPADAVTRLAAIVADRLAERSEVA